MSRTPEDHYPSTDYYGNTYNPETAPGYNNSKDINSRLYTRNANSIRYQQSPYNGINTYKDADAANNYQAGRYQSGSYQLGYSPRASTYPPSQPRVANPAPVHVEGFANEDPNRTQFASPYRILLFGLIIFFIIIFMQYMVISNLQTILLKVVKRFIKEGTHAS